MKATILLCALMLLISISCRNDCNPAYRESNYFEGKEIVLSYDSANQRIHFDTLGGPYLLFQQFHFSEVCEHVYDADWVERLYFAIPDSLNEFKFVDSAIFKSNTYYEKSGAWIYTQEIVKYGVIEGNKLANGDWRVKVDIEVNESEAYPEGIVKHIKFESLYTK